MPTTNQILTQIADAQRAALMSSNEYDGTLSDEYGTNHPNAMSDGDDKGKGDTGTVGSQTDILSRQNLTSANTYNPSNAYGSSHPNALSDGDDKGKGDTGTIGGTTDILTRGQNTSTNEFGPSNQYPNF
jgi:hypothetical protein